jgi:hypothetical protein
MSSVKNEKFGCPRGLTRLDYNAVRPQRWCTLACSGVCLIAGIRLARERQVNVRVSPTGKAIEESVDLAYEIFNRVFRHVPGRVQDR